MDSKDSKNTPRHIAIIMDGNGRWAQKRGLDRVYGHVKGVESVRKVIQTALDKGVEYLTLYAFSTENWGRPSEEVTALMELFCENTILETPQLVRSGVRMRFIGDIQQLSPHVQDSIHASEAATADNNKLTLIIALNYSSRWEITRAVQQIARQVEQGILTPDQITPERISDCLTTAGIPDPDLLIRTSGERRLSNFLLWQLSYSEFYFTEVLWPDFDEQQFETALEDYVCRRRRYGLVTERIDQI